MKQRYTLTQKMADGRSITMEIETVYPSVNVQGNNALEVGFDFNLIRIVAVNGDEELGAKADAEWRARIAAQEGGDDE